MNSTIKIASMVIEELNQANEKSDTGKEGFQPTKSRLGKRFKVKINNQYNVPELYFKNRSTTDQ
jgi:hypothetical protein